MDGRVTYEWTDVWAYVRALIRSLVTCARTYENKVDSSRPYFCTSRFFLTYLVFSYVRAHVTSERVNARTYAHTSVHSYAHVRPLVRHASVHSYAYTYAGSYARPSPRSSALVTRRTLSKITTFYETLKKASLCTFPLWNGLTHVPFQGYFSNKRMHFVRTFFWSTMPFCKKRVFCWANHFVRTNFLYKMNPGPIIS